MTEIPELVTEKGSKGYQTIYPNSSPGFPGKQVNRHRGLQKQHDYRGQAPGLITDWNRLPMPQGMLIEAWPSPSNLFPLSVIKLRPKQLSGMWRLNASRVNWHLTQKGSVPVTAQMQTQLEGTGDSAPADQWYTRSKYTKHGRSGSIQWGPRLRDRAV